MFDLKLKVSHSDLYFMVQWISLISYRRQFDVGIKMIAGKNDSVFTDVWSQTYSDDHSDIYFMVQ